MCKKTVYQSRGVTNESEGCGGSNGASREMHWNRRQESARRGLVGSRVTGQARGALKSWACARARESKCLAGEGHKQTRDVGVQCDLGCNSNGSVRDSGNQALTHKRGLLQSKRMLAAESSSREPQIRRKLHGIISVKEFKFSPEEHPNERHAKHGSDVRCKVDNCGRHAYMCGCMVCSAEHGKPWGVCGPRSMRTCAARHSFQMAREAGD
jgi:hypothetical protein